LKQKFPKTKLRAKGVKWKGDSMEIDDNNPSPFRDDYAYYRCL